MKFSLVSDMHLDFPQLKTPYEKLEKNVVVAGDCGNGLVGLKWLNKLRRKGHNVFAVDGNHEHYSNLSSGREWIETENSFAKENPHDNEIEGVPIVLKNGWYCVPVQSHWLRYMNDGKYGALSATTVNSLAEGHAKFIEERLISWKKEKKKGIVVTHTAPCTETLDPRFEGEYSNYYYYNPYMRRLLQEYSEQIRVWCHGHTHAFSDKIVEGVRVVCNPRGYPRENPNWNPLTIEIKS